MPAKYGWTPETDALLGTMMDKDVARELGVVSSTVGLRRAEMGIPVFGRVKWTPELDALLGKVPSTEIADMLGICTQTVNKRRRRLGISAWHVHEVKWTPEMDAMLGTMSDWNLADELEMHKCTVRLRRKELGISPWRDRVLPVGVERWSKEAERIHNLRRRHFRAEVPDDLTYEQWLFALEWFDRKCAYCGSDEPLGEDHRIPLIEGGPRTALNILPCCPTCNSSKGPKDAQEWIYEKFGREEGREIIDNIVAYLTEVRRLWG